MYDVFISYSTKNQAVADEIYNRLNKEGFHCFLATEDLYQVDWAGQLKDAIENSRAFVLIVSHAMNESNEVLKEVGLATRHSRFIFPFIIDDVKLDSRMEYHLAPFQWIQGIIPPETLNYESLIQRVRDALMGTLDDGNVNFGCLEIVGHNLAPRSEFIGREGEICEIEEFFASGDKSVFLTGMGGIGKSEIARAFAKKNRDKYKTTVMLSYQGDIVKMMIDDRTMIIKGVNRGGANGGQMETDEDYYTRKMSALESVVNDETLLVIDNFDTQEDTHLEDILNLACDKIITTRVNYEEIGYPTVFINAMNPEAELLPLMERMDHKYIKEADRESALKIIGLLDNHTYAVSLTASQMKVGHIAPAKMLEMLINEGLSYKTRSTFSRNVGEKKTATDYIKMLFDFSTLSERETQLLQYMACTPLVGVDIDLFMELAEIDDFEELRQLIALNWIQEDAENNLCRIHMLVRELIKDEVGLSQDAVASYINNLSAKLNKCGGWNNSYEENLLLESSILAMIDVFSEPEATYRLQFEQFGGFCWMMNHFDKAEQVEKYIYDITVKEFGELSEETALMALRVAAVYHNQNDHVHDRGWYQKGKDIMLALGMRNSTTLMAMFKVARSDMLAGHYEEAEKGFLEEIALAEEIIASNDQTVRQNGRTEAMQATIEKMFADGSLAIIKGGNGEYEEAEAILRELPVKAQSDYAVSVSALYFYMALGVLYIKMERKEDALEALNIALDISRSHRVDNKDSILITEMIGDAYVAGGTPIEATPFYVEALNKAERIFPGNLAWIEALTKKYEASKNGEVFEIPYRYLPL